jgi:FixJ family two-component response regulator
MSDDAVVYVVDDDPSVRRALSRLVRSVGLPVETFPTAKAFLDSPTSDQPACLVLDVRLPGASGLDLQSALHDAGRPLPIVFITGHASVSTSVRAMKGGAVDFLQKPFNDQELLDCIQRAIEASRRQRADQAEQAGLAQRHATLTVRERQVRSAESPACSNRRCRPGHRREDHQTTSRQDKMQAGSVADLVRLAERLGLRGAKP